MKHHFYVTVMALLCCTSPLHAEKTFVFAYDDNGNRTTLTFVSTCRMKQPKDTTATPKDTTVTVEDSKLIDSVSTVTQPRVYPTLVRTEFLLSFPADLQNATLHIIDLQGNILYTETGITTAHTLVNACNLPAGMYQVVVYYGQQPPFVQKIIKQ